VVYTDVHYTDFACFIIVDVKNNTTLF